MRGPVSWEQSEVEQKVHFEEQSEVGPREHFVEPSEVGLSVLSVALTRIEGRRSAKGIDIAYIARIGTEAWFQVLLHQILFLDECQDGAMPWFFLSIIRG